MAHIKVKRLVVATFMFAVLFALSACAAPQESSQTVTSSEEEALQQAVSELQEAASLSEEDEEFDNLVSANGLVTSFIGEPFFDKPIETEEDAQAAVDSVITRIGGDDTTHLTLYEIRPTETGTTYYTFRQEAGNVDVYGAAVKLVTDKENNAVGLISAILPNAKADKLEQWLVTQEEAEQIVVEVCKTNDGEDVQVIQNATEQTLLPFEEGSAASIYVWVVYTRNYDTDIDVGYLAHYVSGEGKYLYNIPVSAPSSIEAQTGEVATFAFYGMEAGTWTGTITRSNGSTEEVTVPIMTDSESGEVILGDMERQILCADYADFTYNDTLTPRVQIDGTFDNNEIAIYDTFVKVWDFYDSIGWTSPDDNGTPALLLMDMVDQDGDVVNNAYYSGMHKGFQTFAFNREDPYGDCIDVIGHEFTHCITHTASTTNIYFNDSGAINESISDILGNLLEAEVRGASCDWLQGEGVGKPMRSLKDPHDFGQPEYVWDVYYGPAASEPTEANDCGGAHINSSLLSLVSYKLDQAGMTIGDQVYYWMNVELAMTPTSDFPQLAELLPWCMEQAGYPEFVDAVKAAVEEGRYTQTEKPATPPEGAGYLEVELPAQTSVDKSNIHLLIVPAENYDIDYSYMTWVGLDGTTMQLAAPAGDYRLAVYFFEGEEIDEVLTFIGDGWISTIDEDDPFAKAEPITVSAGDTVTVTLEL